MADISVVGGGLAGCEAAWQAARSGLRVALYEMRPYKQTPAHQTHWLAEIICSNSFGTNQRNRPAGLLKTELRLLNSLIIHCADDCSLPAGNALAVDRELFSRTVTEQLGNTTGIEIFREEITSVPEGPCIIASGPLTSPALCSSISSLLGSQFLYFYDAISPIVEYESIDMSKAFWGSRYGSREETEGDYLNCPLNEEEYSNFVQELINAKKVDLKAFEQHNSEHDNKPALKYFEACLPIEVLAAREIQALSYGPLRPVGITDPHTGRHPFAVLQLRQDNLAKTLFNLVGFQTNLTYPEQERVFRLIPGLEKAVFARFGQMHRNTYINAPHCLLPTGQSRQRPDLFFAGQIMGSEGYAGNIASGLVAGLNIGRLLQKQELIVFPRESMIGALMFYLTNSDPHSFRPMKANFGLLPDLDSMVRSKKDRGFVFSKRAIRVLSQFITETGIVDYDT